jgi:hypothetical protein
MRFTDNCWVQRFICPIYRTTYIVVTAEDIHSSRSVYEKITGSEYQRDGAKAFATEIKGRGINGLTVMLTLPIYGSPGLVSHEIKHAVNMNFLHVGYQLDTRNDEHECYYLQWLTQKVYDVLFKAQDLKKEQENGTRTKKSPLKSKK